MAPPGTQVPALRAEHPRSRPSLRKPCPQLDSPWSPGDSPRLPPRIISVWLGPCRASHRPHAQHQAGVHWMLGQQGRHRAGRSGTQGQLRAGNGASSLSQPPPHAMDAGESSTGPQSKCTPRGALAHPACPGCGGGETEVEGVPPSSTRTPGRLHEGFSRRLAPAEKGSLYWALVGHTSPPEVERSVPRITASLGAAALLPHPGVKPRSGEEMPPGGGRDAASRQFPALASGLLVPPGRRLPVWPTGWAAGPARHCAPGIP